MSRSCFHYGRGLILHKITELSSLSGCIRQPLSASCLVAVYLLFRVLLQKLQQISVSVCRKASADADRENYHSCKCCAAAGCLANKQTNKQTNKPQHGLFLLSFKNYLSFAIRSLHALPATLRQPMPCVCTRQPNEYG